MPDQLSKQPIAIEPIGLHVPQPPAHLDAGGVHDLVLDADAHQVSVPAADLAVLAGAMHNTGAVALPSVSWVVGFIFWSMRRFPEGAVRCVLKTMQSVSRA